MKLNLFMSQLITALILIGCGNPSSTSDFDPKVNMQIGTETVTDLSLRYGTGNNFNLTKIMNDVKALSGQCLKNSHCILHIEITKECPGEYFGTLVSSADELDLLKRAYLALRFPGQTSWACPAIWSTRFDIKNYRAVCLSSTKQCSAIFTEP